MSATVRKPYCPDCNGVGMSHCSDPENCGGVIYPQQDNMIHPQEKAYEFICWYRHMAIMGQIIVSKYALDRIPCSDYELEKALRPMPPSGGDPSNVQVNVYMRNCPKCGRPFRTFNEQQGECLICWQGDSKPCAE